MMKLLYFLIFVAMSQAYVSTVKGDQVSQAFESKEKRDRDSQANESNDSEDYQDSPAFESREKVDDQDLPAPRLLRLTLVDDPSEAFKVEWNKVDIPDGVAPILGYKLKVWEQRNVKKNNTGKSSENDPLPLHKPRDVYVNGPEKTSALVKGIEHGVTYQVRVQAYNRNGNGPLSDSMTIKIAPKDTARVHTYV